MNIYIYKYYWTTLLYRRIQHNFVKQLYLNKLFFQELIRKSICTSTIENSMEVPQNSKDRTTVWSKTLTLPGIHPKEVKAQKDINPHAHLCNSQDMETTKLSTDGYKDKEYVIHTQWNVIQP